MRLHDLAIPAGVLLLATAVAGHLWLNPPDPSRWPRCEYYRCVTCDGPASIDPHQPERWGCLACDYHTWRIAERFRTPNPGEFSRDDLAAAQMQAGVMVSDGCRSPVMIYWEARRVMGWEN